MAAQMFCTEDGQCSGETDLADPGEETGMTAEMDEGVANNFLELHMHEEPPDSNVEDVANDNTQVILIYQDVLTCGVCNKQFVELTDFLAHKGLHTIGHTQFYKCEICKIVFGSTETLYEHYDQKHQVPLTYGEESLLPPGEIDGNEVGQGEDSAEHVDEANDLNSQKEHYSDTNEENNDVTLDEAEINKPETSVEPTKTADRRKTALLKSKMLSNRRLSLKSYRQQLKQLQKQRNDGGGDMPVNNNNVIKSDNSDFTFVLMTESVKGNSFTYGRTWFKCLHCKFKTAGKLCLTNHMRDQHSDVLDLHQNLEVKDEQEQDENYKVIRMSTYEANYIRDKRFRRRQTKRPKLESRDIIGRFPCDKCDKVFSRQRYLRKHTEIHRTEKKFICDICGKPFISRNYLTVHKRSHIKVKMFKCNQCDFTSNMNAAIHAHRQVHSQGSVLCDICGFAYTDKATLTKHKRVHDINRPFACTFSGCTWRFKTEVMCRAHQKAHVTEGKFKCTQCGYAFRQKHHLQRHEAKIHGIQHTKSNRANNPSSQSRTATAAAIAEEMTDTVHLVVNTCESGLQLCENGLEQHLVVTAPINLETDLSALNVAYQTLLHTTDKNGSDTHTILLNQPDTEIVFQHE